MTDSVPDPAAILHLATLSTLQSTGFISTPTSCAGILTSALERYITAIARKSLERAQVNGRNGSSVNVYDVERAIDGFGHGGIEELRDWADHALMGPSGQMPTLTGKGVQSLGDLVRLGLPLPHERDQIELRYLPVSETELDDNPEASASTSASSPEPEAEKQDINMKSSPSSSPAPAVKRKRSASLDEGYESAGSSSHPWHQQWMPPLPGSSLNPTEIEEPNISNDALELASLPNPPIPDSNPTTASTDSFNRSQLDSYLQPIPYSSSMLSESHPHSQLSLKPRSTTTIQSKPSSSFPALLTAYQETANDPSMTLSVKPLRQAAAWFLIQGASNPDSYTPPDTLFASPIATPPPVRSCPIVPVHPIPDTTSGTIPPFPLPLLPLDPSPPTIRDIVQHPPPLLSTLVRDLAGQSPFLPRPLRDRLTSLRPPNPLNGAYYGPPVTSHGVTLRATWDSGRADCRDGRLPTGRKVVKEVTGHEGPLGGAGKVTIRLGSSSPLPAAETETAAATTESTQVPTVDPATSIQPSPTPAPPQTPVAPEVSQTAPKPGGLKLKLFSRPVAPSLSPGETS